jgi:hypothetical protein
MTAHPTHKERTVKNRAIAPVLLFILSLFASSLVLAQATGTWVSGVGDDANPCSRTAPCKTFAGAISKTAAGGEIRVLDPGGFGALTITKSITINGDGTLASILVAGTNGIVVSAGVNDVVIIRNLSIIGLVPSASAGLNGIRFLAGAELHVENVKIYGFSQQGIDFNPNAASSLFVTGTTLRNNTANAVWVHPTGTGSAVATLDRVSMDGNGAGLRVEDGSLAVARDCEATGNSGHGFAAVSASRRADVSIENCVSSQNAGAGVVTSGALAVARISNMMITHNNTGVTVVGGSSILSFGNNRVLGNNSNNGPVTATMGEI